MHNVCQIILTTNTIFIDLMRFTLPKPCEIADSSLKDFFSKGRKSVKNA